MAKHSFDDLIGCFISERVLRGRGYHCQSGPRPLPGIENEGNTWFKLLTATEQEGFQEAYIIIVLHMSEAFHVEDHDAIIQYVGLEDTSLEKRLRTTVLKELNALSKGIHVPPYFRLSGKKVPKECKNDWDFEEFNATGTKGPFREYRTVLQSNEGNRYFQFSLFADSKDTITGYEMMSYISTGNAYGDLLPRPRRCKNHKEDLLFAKLSVLELYEENEMDENNLVFHEIERVKIG